MSAITGIFYRNNRSVEFDQIKKMNDSLSHRGPDDSKVLNYESIALGHQMLYTTKESLKETLPFKDKSGLIITADARIDNREELTDQLNIDNSPENSDSQFILEAYKKWGEKCPEKLLGDFSFAIWDIEEQKLFCARDHMGIKSFYYYLTDDAIFFATEIRALFTNPEVKCKLNEMKIPLYLSASEEKSTFFENIVSLNASESMTVTTNTLKIKKYWELDPNYKITMKSEEEYIKAFKDIFSEAINCRLRSVYPVGFELSGGLDSSSVVCMAKKILKIQDGNLNKLKTFSLIFKGFPKGDESYYIQKVIDKGGIEPHFVDGTNVGLIKNIENVLNHQEQPYYAPFLPVIYKSYEKMCENNIRILLGGMGGDHIVSYGQKYLIDLLLSFKWQRLIKEVRYFSKNQKISYLNVFKLHIIIPLIPVNLKEIFKRIFSKKFLHIPIVYNTNFLKKLKQEKNFELKHIKIPKEPIKAKKFHYSLIQQIMILENTMEMLDHGTSNYSIEPRYPYLDKRLVEFCYGIPSEMKFKSGWKRYIQRVAMEGILPPQIQWRVKKGVISDVFQKNLFLFENNSDALIDDIKLNEYLDLNNIKKIYNNYKTKNNNTYTFDTYILWKVLLLSKWLDKL